MTPRCAGTGRDPDGEGACHNRDEAATFIRRALADGLTAELLDVREANNRMVAVIHTHAPPDWERSPEPHGELVTVRDGTITEMIVYPTVDDALAAAGLGKSPKPRAAGRVGPRSRPGPDRAVGVARERSRPAVGRPNPDRSS